LYNIIQNIVRSPLKYNYTSGLPGTSFFLFHILSGITFLKLVLKYKAVIL